MSIIFLYKFLSIVLIIRIIVEVYKLNQKKVFFKFSILLLLIHSKKIGLPLENGSIVLP